MVGNVRGHASFFDLDLACNGDFVDLVAAKKADNQTLGRFGFRFLIGTRVQILV